MKTKRFIDFISRVAIFGSLAVILYCIPYLQFALPFTPSFLKIHFDEIPILIAGYAYGPGVSFAIIILKGLIKLIQDIPETGGIGVLTDVLYSSAFILPAAFIYKKHRSLKGAIISFSVGALSQLIMSSVVGLYTIYPLYGFFFNPQAKTYDEAMVTVGYLFSALDNRIETAKDHRIMYEFLLPFNLIKNGIVGLVTFLTYKPLEIFLQKKNSSK